MTLRKSPTGRVARRPKPEHPHTSVRAFQVGEGLPDIEDMRDEIDDMKDVLMGRVPPPIDAGVMTLMEVASAYHARAQELTLLLQRAESLGTSIRGGPHAKYRTTELRTFVEMAKAAAELGSRRLSAEQLEWDQARMGRDL